MIVLSIDPGNKESAWLIYSSQTILPVIFGKCANLELIHRIHDKRLQVNRLAIETMKPRGMPTAFEEMQTQLWAGRFIQAFYSRYCTDDNPINHPAQIFRNDVKMLICGNVRAKDSNIRAALIDRYGGESKAIGGKNVRVAKANKLTNANRATHAQMDGYFHPAHCMESVPTAGQHSRSR